MDGVTAALWVIGECQPKLVLLESDLLGSETETVLHHIKTRWPQIQCVLLSDDILRPQIQVTAMIFPKMFPVTKLVTIVQGLLP